MNVLEVFHKKLRFETKGNKATYFDITEECKAFLKEIDANNGLLVIQSPHTTCSVFFEEMVHDYDALEDEYLQQDLNKGLRIIFPKQLSYDDYYKYPGREHRMWGSTLKTSALKENPSILLNADAHLKSSIIGSNLNIVIKDGTLLIRNYGHIYFVDFDSNRVRQRNCNLCCLKLN